MNKVCRNFFSVVLGLLLGLFLVVSLCFTNIVSAEDLCGPVLDGAILFVAPECLNDSTAMVVDSTIVDQYGWQYSNDSDSDGVTGAVLGGGVFELYGMAFRETQTELWIVINGNLPLTGNPNSGAAGGSVGWGDLFINITDSTFLAANNNQAFFAVRFADTNDSGAPTVGLYGQADGKSVTSVNSGFASWGAYATHVTNNGGIPILGDFGQNQTYYAPTISLNVIQGAVRLGDVQMLTLTQLAQDDFNTLFFQGSVTIGLKFTKRLIIDECGVIGGDGTSCLDCNEVPCGKDEWDECEVCAGDGPGECGCDLSIVKDSCGRCGGNGPGECGCNLELVKDECGRCGGDGPGECGCDLDIVKDECGRCGGNGPGECGCNSEIVDLGCGCGEPAPGACGCNPELVDLGCGCGEPAPGECGCDPNIVDLGCGCGNPAAGECGCNLDIVNLGCGCGNPAAGECGCNLDIVKDDCGVCDGNNEDKDDCGVCDGNNADKDDCGVCSGNNADQDDCGVCNGSNKDKGCDNICFSGTTIDDCGICGGDGSSCLDISECREIEADEATEIAAKLVKKTAKVLKRRVDRFAKASAECDGKNYKKIRKKAKKQLKKVKEILAEKITNTILVCNDSICTKESTGEIQTKLRRIAKKLFRLAKNAKLVAMDVCNYQHKPTPEKVKITEDYRDDLLDAIDNLPGEITQCIVGE